MNTVENCIVEATAVKEDGSLMIVAYYKDEPNILFSYDNVKFVQDCNGDVFLEFDQSVSARLEQDLPSDEELTRLGEKLLHELARDIIEGE